MVAAARHFGVDMLPFSPLSNGLLTGKVRRRQPVPDGTRLASRTGYYVGYVTDEKLDKVEAMIAWAEEHGITGAGASCRRAGGPAGAARR